MNSASQPYDSVKKLNSSTSRIRDSSNWISAKYWTWIEELQLNEIFDIFFFYSCIVPELDDKAHIAAHFQQPLFSWKFEHIWTIVESKRLKKNQVNDALSRGLVNRIAFGILNDLSSTPPLSFSFSFTWNHRWILNNFYADADAPVHITCDRTHSLYLSGCTCWSTSGPSIQCITELSHTCPAHNIGK